MTETEKMLVGVVKKYFGKISVAAIELSEELKASDEIAIEGATTKAIQQVGVMEIDHEALDVAKKGMTVGVKVAGKVREGDNVYRITGGDD